MMRCKYWGVLLPVFMVLVSTALSEDACEHYTLMENQHHRSSGFSAQDGENYSDRYLKEGWYRFTGYQGQDMVTEPPELHKCGTIFPIWLNGVIPDEADGEVSVQACVVSIESNNNCNHAYMIKIKNCGDYRVYHLLPTAAQDEAYCIGTEVPCPEGEFSENGNYTPNCIAATNECEASNGGCDHTCTGSLLSYTCTCRHGYILSAEDEHSCIDVDECEVGNGLCEEICTNTPGGHQCSQDPCAADFPHTVLESPYNRSSSYGIQAGDESLNDRYLDEGWYRITGHQGGDMPTSPPELDMCGANFPIYLDGSIPAPSDGIVTGTGCVVSIMPGTKCNHEYDVQIRNCGDYRMYYLRSTEGANEAYCFGENIPCPQGEYSENGHYTPGCRPDIDECATDKGGCDHVCTNDVLAYTCSCNGGYTQDTEDAHVCNDNDECADGSSRIRRLSRCAHTCHNTDGSYECSCNDGYTLNADGSSCNDIDECADESDDCAHACGNTDGGFVCSCNPGYTLNADASSCDDNNECADGTAGCSHICDNTDGSYGCRCNPGYTLNADGHSCDDNNECVDGSHNCAQICGNTDGSFVCSCNPGYTLNADRSSCDDNNECADVTDGCAHICDNTDGSYECRCNPGYTLNADGHSCDDNNECADGTHNCAQICGNTDGSFECSCNPGYTLNADGHSCDDNNECEDETDGCMHSCHNNPGSYECRCNGGFTLNADGHSCDDNNECDDGTARCIQICKNNPGSYACSCNDGYSLNADGHSCDDIDECVLNNGGCNQDCNNEAGSYYCSCQSDGYELSADRHTCLDKNECDDGTHGCAHTCDNSVGSYACSCDNGFLLNPDGHSCDDVDECEFEIDNCNQQCQNTPGGFVCKCDDGYHLLENNWECEDKDECNSGVAGCEHGCTNLAPFYQCFCHPGYALNVDGHSCSNINECAAQTSPCSHGCTDNVGSFVCSCENGYVLGADQRTCKDDNECEKGDNGHCSDLCVNFDGGYHCECPDAGERLLPNGRTCIVERPTIPHDSGYIRWGIEHKLFTKRAITMRHLIMECHVDHDDELIYDVTWSIGTTAVKTETGIAMSDMPAELFESDWNSEGGAQQTVYCQVTPRRFADWADGADVTFEYFMGFTVDSTQLVVEEGGDAAEYVIRPTVPVLCPVGMEAYGVLSLEVHTPVLSGNTNNPAVCRDGTPIDQTSIEFHQTPCRMDIPCFEEITEGLHFSLPISAAIDGRYDGEQQLAVQIQGPEKFQYHPFWEGVQLPEAKVTVTDRDVNLARKVCKARNDPHMTTLDGRIYENQLEGEFVLFKHKKLPIEVRGFFVRCSGYATCIGGTAVRSGGDFFLYDSGRILTSSGSTFRVEMYECGDGSMRVEQVTSTRYKITLPTGTVIVADRNLIQIVPSISDYNQVEGLCGTLDNDCSNDFMGSDGQYSTHQKAGLTSCDNRNGWDRYFHPDDFTSSYKVSWADSWYNGMPQDSSAPFDKKVYCSCNDKQEAVCETGPAGATVIEHCLEIKQAPAMDRCVSRKKRDADSGDYVVKDVGSFPDSGFVAAENPDYTNGWTEDSARNHCEKLIADNALLVQGNVLFPGTSEGAVETCMGDILLSGGSEHSATHLQDALLEVDRELSKNMSLYASDGSYLGPHFIDEICPNECNGHGNCVNRECECEAGYTDSDCGLEVGHLPASISLPTQGMCDLNGRPCLATQVYADYYIASEDLTCQVQPVVVKNGHMVLKPSVVGEGRYENLMSVTCQLPPAIDDLDSDDVVLTYGYKVSVSNNGKAFSSAKTLTVFDSGCVECNPDGDLDCEVKAHTCSIGGTCYVDAQASATDSCNVCKSSQSQTAFSLSDECGGAGGLNTGLVAGLSVAVVAACIAAVVGSIAYVVHKKNAMNKVQDSTVKLNVDA